MSNRKLEDLMEQQHTKALASALRVVGLVNVQFAVRRHQVFVLEVNPRASRTVPYVSKAVGRPFARYAARIMAGERLVDIGYTREEPVSHHAEVAVAARAAKGVVGPVGRGIGQPDPDGAIRLPDLLEHLAHRGKRTMGTRKRQRRSLRGQIVLGILKRRTGSV